MKKIIVFLCLALSIICMTAFVTACTNDVEPKTDEVGETAENHSESQTTDQTAENGETDSATETEETSEESEEQPSEEPVEEPFLYPFFLYPSPFFL